MSVHCAYTLSRILCLPIFGIPEIIHSLRLVGGRLPSRVDFLGGILKRSSGEFSMRHDSKLWRFFKINLGNDSHYFSSTWRIISRIWRGKRLSLLASGFF